MAFSVFDNKASEPTDADVKSVLEDTTNLDGVLKLSEIKVAH